MQDPEGLGHPGQGAARFHPAGPEEGGIRGLQGLPAQVTGSRVQLATLRTGFLGSRAEGLFSKCNKHRVLLRHEVTKPKAL